MIIGRKKIALLGFAATLALGAGQANAATIVDVSASSSSGTTLFLDAGTYAFNFIGTAAGGAYDAWNAWGNVSGCNSGGSNCAHGWLVSLGLDLGNGVSGFDRTNGNFYWEPTTSSQTNFFSTASAANATALNSGFMASPLSGPNPGSIYTAPSSPFTFTLASAQDVNFFVKDSNYSDNLGGVSLSLSRVAAVPEPASWAMMLVGFGAMGAAMRRRKAPVAVRFA